MPLCSVHQTQEEVVHMLTIDDMAQYWKELKQHDFNALTLDQQRIVLMGNALASLGSRVEKLEKVLMMTDEELEKCNL